MKKRLHTIVFLLFSLALILLCQTVLRMWDISVGNRRWTDTETAAGSPYALGIPLQEMVKRNSQSGEWNYLQPFLAHTSFDFAEDWVITLKEPIHFYESPVDGTPVKTLEAGTEVFFGKNIVGVTDYVGYGNRSLPTYEPGWRYMKALVRAEESLTKERFYGLSWYYVQAEEAESLIDTAYEELWENLLGNMKNQRQALVENGRLASYENGDEYLKRTYYYYAVDRILVENKAYCSNDLLYPLLDRANVWLLIAAGACIVTGAGLFLWEKKRQKVSA